MSWLREPAVNQPARVLLVSQRAAARQVSRALQYEYEDFVQSVDSADLVASARSDLPPSMVRRATALASHLAPGASRLLEGECPDVRDGYDLVFVGIESLHDLEFVRPLTWLLRRARVSVCLVDEVWRKGLERRTGELRLLSQFDHVLVGTAGAVDAVTELTGRPTSYFPPSVDALALCPYPDALPRVIDVYSMGRRPPVTHAALLELARRRQWFYLYDTLAGTAPDHRQHRRHLAELLKRTRLFLAYPGKMDAPEETGGQQELGYRYFEGAAAGAVLIGEAPANPWFEKLFGWKDAIVHLPYDASSPEVLLAAFEHATVREQAIRRNNVVESLRRHDHLYRWADVLRLAGLPEMPAMEHRRRELRERADLLERGQASDAFVGRVVRRS